MEIKKLNPKVFIGVGGHFVSYAFKEVLPTYLDIDAVFLGEGEKNVVAAIKKLINRENLDEVEGIAQRDEFGSVFYKDNKNYLNHDLDSTSMLFSKQILSYVYIMDQN